VRSDARTATAQRRGETLTSGSLQLGSLALVALVERIELGEQAVGELGMGGADELDAAAEHLGEVGVAGQVLGLEAGLPRVVEDGAQLAAVAAGH